MDGVFSWNSQVEAKLAGEQAEDVITIIAYVPFQSREGLHFRMLEKTEGSRCNIHPRLFMRSHA